MTSNGQSPESNDPQQEPPGILTEAWQEVFGNLLAEHRAHAAHALQLIEERAAHKLQLLEAQMQAAVSKYREEVINARSENARTVAERLALVRDGERGRPGEDGADGIDGRDGSPGPRGERGLTGPVGPAGPAGEGIRGERGPTGPKGERGDLGLPGIPGAAGNSIVVGKGMPKKEMPDGTIYLDAESGNLYEFKS